MTYGFTCCYCGVQSFIMTTNMAKADYETQQVTIRIPDKILDAIERIGDRFGIRRSQLIIRACEEYILNHQADQPTPVSPQRKNH